jgi:hypothetical protein
MLMAIFFIEVTQSLSTVSKKFAIVFVFIFSFVSQGEFFKEGDIVSVTDVGGDIFYAQLRGFLTDEYGEKSGVIRYNHRVHRVATVAFWRTFDHEGKLAQAGEDGGCMPPPSLHLPSRRKLQCTLQLRG